MLTEKQKEIFSFIRHYIFKNNISPTEQEISEQVNIVSRGVIHRHLVKIASAKLIKLTGKKRGIQLVNPKQYMQLPIMGLIACGKPIESLEEIKVLDLADLMLGSNRFVLQVKGDSMNGDNICDTDYIICEKRDTVKDNEIAVVIVNQSEATLKRVKKNKDGTVTLIASNPNVKPMIYATDAIKIQGVYLGLIRLKPEQL